MRGRGRTSGVARRRHDAGSPAAGRGYGCGTATHGSRELRGAPRERHHRPRALSARAARRPALEPDPRPLPRCDRQRQELLLRERHRRVREIPLRARRRHQGGRRRAGIRHFPALPAAQPGAHELRDRAARQEAGLRHRRILHVRSREGALAGERRRDERAVAQAGQERCAFAHHHRQAVARGGRHLEEALRARGEAHGPEQARRCVRGVHERLRAVPGSAFELLLRAQLRGIQHPDEPLLRGHRGIAAADRRLRHGDRRDRRRPRRDLRQALRQRPHHRGG